MPKKKATKATKKAVKPKKTKKAVAPKKLVTKEELVKRIAKATDVSRKDSAEFVNAFVEEVTKALSKGESVRLMGFGGFEVRERAERKGRNPQTGEEIVIPARKTPAFKPGKNLKDAIK